MTTILSDNTVIPSYMGATPRGRPFDMGLQSNVALRFGEVKKVVYPDDQTSTSKKFIEYVVDVQSRDGNGPVVVTTYRSCVTANLFGGAADRMTYTLRANPQHAPGEIGTGSKVLLLCINGNQGQAIILGGVRDITTAPAEADSKDDGHNLSFEFNGVNVEINDGGELKIQLKGATAVTGQPRSGNDDSATPTTVQITKDGNFHVYTKDGAQSMLIDHANKKADFLFDKNWNVKVNGDVAEDYGGKWEVSSGSTITVNASERSYIKSAGLQIGAATDALLKGTTYRVAETTMHTTLVSSLAVLAAQIAAAGVALTTGMPLLLIPVAGPIAFAPLAGVAGASLTSALATIATMTSAIAAFEAGSASYLSLVNNSD